MNTIAGNEGRPGLMVFPVLAINAPTFTTQKVLLPGDPISLYAALAVSAARALDDRGLAQPTFFTEGAPDFGGYPTMEARLADSGETTLANYLNPSMPNDCIFDPRIWNEEVKHNLTEILQGRLPRVVMISNTSLGHPFAIEIAQLVKSIVPGAITIIGGAHEDETMRCIRGEASVTLSYASTLRSLMTGRTERVIDFSVSGDGEFALSYLLKIIGAAMPEDGGFPIKEDVFRLLKERRTRLQGQPGLFCVGYLDNYEDVVMVASKGELIDYKELPPLYRLFLNRSRFDVFSDENGRPKRTAHIMTVRGCPNSCIYCSEGRGVQKNAMPYFRDCGVNYSASDVVALIKEYVSYGAGAAFFDDSIILGGNRAKIVEFCNGLIAERESLDDEAKAGGLMGFEWGGQFTVEDVLADVEIADQMLDLMRRAGCSYIYVGVESLDENIMRGIDKHRYRNKKTFCYDNWEGKVDAALQVIQSHGIRVGVSAQFGLPGETDESIDRTINGFKKLIDDGKIFLISPNICTYHPGTPLTYMHHKTRLEFLKPPVVAEPYSLFEESSPDYASVVLNEGQLWHISRRIYRDWNTINRRKENSADADD